MTDSDNDHTDDKTGLSTAFYKRRNYHERKNDIYERFLQDIQNIGKDTGVTAVDANHVDMSHEQSTFEPLNEEELLFFKDSSENSDTFDSDDLGVSADSINNTGTTIDSSNDDISDKQVRPDSTTSNEDDVSNLVLSEMSSDTVPKQLPNIQQLKDKKRVGKLILIGALCGVLFIAIAVAFATGILAALTDSSEPKNMPVASTEPVVKVDTANNVNLPVTEEVTEADHKNVDDTATEKEMPVVTTVIPTKPLDVPDANVDNNSNEVSTNDKASISKNADVEDQGAISFEDFQKESQNTLYRDSKD